LKYRPNGGALSFDFNDPNPAISWSVLDYWRVPKSSYYELKKAFSPVYAFALLNFQNYPLNKNLSLPIFAVNDLNQKIEARLSAKVISPVQELLYHQEFQVILDPDSPALAIANPSVQLRSQGKYQLQLKLSWQGKELENNYGFTAE
jgi:beta-mannosidase